VHAESSGRPWRHWHSDAQFLSLSVSQAKKWHLFGALVLHTSLMPRMVLSPRNMTLYADAALYTPDGHHHQSSLSSAPGFRTTCCSFWKIKTNCTITGTVLGPEMSWIHLPLSKASATNLLLRQRLETPCSKSGASFPTLPWSKHGRRQSLQHHRRPASRPMGASGQTSAARASASEGPSHIVLGQSHQGHLAVMDVELSPMPPCIYHLELPRCQTTRIYS
jgi:hypothetical protein